MHTQGMDNLLEETTRLAKSTKLPVKAICEAADVKPRWFYRFIAGDYEDPGVGKITRLHKVLSEDANKVA